LEAGDSGAKSGFFALLGIREEWRRKNIGS
jgi:hypothetical protein